MRFGAPWSSGWGAPENHFVYVVPDYYGAAASGGLYLPFVFLLRPGLDANGSCVGIYRNAAWVRNVGTKAATPYNGQVDIPWGTGSGSLLPLRIGHLSDPAYADAKVARTYESTENGRATLQFTFTPKVFVPPLSDGGWTSNWTLSGAVQGQNCAYVNGHGSWGRLGLAIGVSGGNATVTLTNNGTIVASGTAVIAGAPFVLTLTAQNNSGLSGTVTLSNLVAAVAAGTVDLRWPTSVQVLRDTFSPPTTVRDTVNFSGINTVRWTEAADLPAGTFYYATQPISDTAITGLASAPVSITTVIPPAPPTNVAYSSGNAAACVLSFTDSVTAGATYRAYVATAVGGVLNLNDIQATAIAGATTITLPALTGYPGTIYVVLRAFSGGVEERNLNIIALEFDAGGAIVRARPNVPQLSKYVVSSGRTLTVTGIYNKDHQLGVATTLRLMIRTPSGTYSQVGTGGTLSSLGLKGLQLGTVAYTPGADGYYYISLVSETAGGVQSKIDSSVEQLVLVSNDQLPAATGVTVQLSRS